MGIRHHRAGHKATRIGREKNNGNQQLNISKWMSLRSIMIRFCIATTLSRTKIVATWRNRRRKSSSNRNGGLRQLENIAENRVHNSRCYELQRMCVCVCVYLGVWRQKTRKSTVFVWHKAMHCIKMPHSRIEYVPHVVCHVIQFAERFRPKLRPQPLPQPQSVCSTLCCFLSQFIYFAKFTRPDWPCVCVCDLVCI